MLTLYRVTVATAAFGIAALSLTSSAQAGNGSAVGAGLLGFGVGAVVGSALAPQTVYVAPPAGLLRATSAGVRRACLRRTGTCLRWTGVLRTSVSRSSTLATSNRSSVLRNENPALLAGARVSWEKRAESSHELRDRPSQMQRPK